MRDDIRQALCQPPFSIRPASTSSEPPTILVIDHDPGTRELCISALSQAGFSVLQADNSLEALLVALDRQGAIDLVVADLGLSQISGAELGRTFQLIWPYMHLLYMSQSSPTSFGEELPIDCAFLPKPFTPDELLQAVSSVLESDRPAVQRPLVASRDSLVLDAAASSHPQPLEIQPRA